MGSGAAKAGHKANYAVETKSDECGPDRLTPAGETSLFLEELRAHKNEARAFAEQVLTELHDMKAQCNPSGLLAEMRGIRDAVGTGLEGPCPRPPGLEEIQAPSPRALEPVAVPSPAASLASMPKRPPPFRAPPLRSSASMADDEIRRWNTCPAPAAWQSRQPYKDAAEQLDTAWEKVMRELDDTKVRMNAATAPTEPCAPAIDLSPLLEEIRASKGEAQLLRTELFRELHIIEAQIDTSHAAQLRQTQEALCQKDALDLASVVQELRSEVEACKSQKLLELRGLREGRPDTLECHAVDTSHAAQLRQTQEALCQKDALDLAPVVQELRSEVEACKSQVLLELRGLREGRPDTLEFHAVIDGVADHSVALAEIRGFQDKLYAEAGKIFGLLQSVVTLPGTEPKGNAKQSESDISAIHAETHACNSAPKGSAITLRVPPGEPVIDTTLPLSTTLPPMVPLSDRSVSQYESESSRALAAERLRDLGTTSRNLSKSRASTCSNISSEDSPRQLPGPELDLGLGVASTPSCRHLG